MKSHIEIYDIINKASNKGGSLSLTRLGDGEARILNFPNDKKAAEHSLIKHTGKMPPEKEILEIREHLISAYNNSDIIGIPIDQHFRTKDKYWCEAKELMFKYAPDSEFADLCSINIHSKFLLYNIYEDLLYNRDDVYIITGRDVAEGLKEKYNIKNVHQFLISPQYKFEVQKTENKHYPEQFNKIKEWITNLELSGHICLVGAGFTGKVYCTWFKQAGGIGIDIGHVFDAWAGLVTRGKNRGAGVTDNTYKL